MQLIYTLFDYTLALFGLYTVESLFSFGVAWSSSLSESLLRNLSGTRNGENLVSECMNTYTLIHMRSLWNAR